MTKTLFIKHLKTYSKASFSLFCCIFMLYSCQPAVVPEIEIAPPPPYQYPKDSLWRGIPLQIKEKAYLSHQFPQYLDSLQFQIDQSLHFNYPYGIQESEVDALLAMVHQKKMARIRYLNDLGIPIYNPKAQKIKYLNLSNRDLVNIPAEIGRIKNLKELLLRDNMIQSIPMQLSYCKQLRRLDLSSNIIAQIPYALSRCSNLEELYLRDNRLNSLPNSLRRLRNLKTLDISNMHRSMAKGQNKFNYIPPAVCHLPNLERLLLEKLEIRTIPVSLLYLKKLKVLSLSGCYQLNMNNTFRILAQMPSLQVLDISFTGRSRLPNDILRLKQLKVLIWQEEGNLNRAEIKRLKNLLPNTKIYSGASGEQRPFLRGNSINTIINAGR